MTPTGSVAVPPDAVRVWRGFRARSTSLLDFYTRLGTVFVPAIMEMQVQIGLDAYVPTALAGLTAKPDTTPDDTAILFWDSQQRYRDGFLTVAARTLSLTYGAAYADGSRADFPVPFAGTVSVDQPYYLVPQPADWMTGTVTHLVGGRPPAMPPAQFHDGIAGALTAIQGRPGLTGAIACCGDDYVAYWVLDPPMSESGASTAEIFGPLCAWACTVTSKPTALPTGLWDPWPGLTLAPGDSLNLQFARRMEW